MGLLDSIIQSGQATKRNIRSLLDDPSGYANALLNRGMENTQSYLNKYTGKPYDPSQAKAYEDAMKEVAFQAMFGNGPSMSIEQRQLNALGQKIPPTKYELAHQTAQRNAALPVEQGGLGLPANNTAMDRARAMGFDTDLFHGRYRDYSSIKDGRTFYATGDPEYASIYAFEPTASSMGGKSVSDFDNLQPNVMPVKVRSKDMLDTRTKEGKRVFNNDFYMQYGNGTPLTEKGLPDWVDAEDFGEMFANTGSKYKGVLADEGKIPTWEGGLKDRGISHAVFDPSAVRSRFAAFDPLRRNESDLLASRLLPIAGTGLLGSYILSNDYAGQ